MNSPVLTAMLPVVLLIGFGFFAGRRNIIDGAAVKGLSNLVFLLLTPVLLFRTMSSVHLEQLDFSPVAAYFTAAALIFTATLALKGFNRRAAVLALANTFSNTVMIGISLVSLAYGQAGLVTLLTLISVHSLVLLTTATVVLELAVAREAAQQPHAAQRSIAVTVFSAAKNAVLHPVPLPIICGLLFAQTGWAIPAVIDQPMALLANAFAPLALLLVGITLAAEPVGPHLRGALGLSLVKNFVHPALVAALGWLMGLSGLPLAVMVLTAALPIGANVFLFSQRYEVAQELVTAAVAVSTVLGVVSVTLVMLWVGGV
jgi:malonate transporter and related proteins